MSASVLVELRVYYRDGTWMGHLDGVQVAGDVRIHTDLTIRRVKREAAADPEGGSWDLVVSVPIHRIPDETRELTVRIERWDRRMAGGGRWGSGFASRAQAELLLRLAAHHGSVEWSTAEGPLSSALRREGYCR